MDPTTVPPITTLPQQDQSFPPAAPMQPQPTQFPSPQPLPPPVPPMPQEGTQSVISGGSSKKGLGGFGIFVIVAIIILASVWGVVAYLYIGNKNKTAQETANNEAAVEVSPTAIPFNATEIQITNGDVARLSSVGETQTLVKKEDYPGSGLIGFAHVAVSPDNTKLCFESIPPASDPTLYISNVDGTNVETVVKNKHTCTWSPDNNFLFYINDTLGNKQIDIYAYSLTSKEERNLTEKTST